MCIKSVFESINSIRHNDMFTIRLLDYLTDTANMLLMISSRLHASDNIFGENSM